MKWKDLNTIYDDKSRQEFIYIAREWKKHTQRDRKQISDKCQLSEIVNLYTPGKRAKYTVAGIFTAEKSEGFKLFELRTCQRPEVSEELSESNTEVSQHPRNSTLPTTYTAGRLKSHVPFVATVADII